MPRAIAPTAFTVTFETRAGHCRWCGCTERDPCPAGCGWADAQRTLCTACAAFDKSIRTARGRQEIARRWQGAELPP